jgi:hypothetical protein
VAPYNHYVDLLDTSGFWLMHLQDDPTCAYYPHVIMLFAKFMTQVIRLEVNYPKYRIKSIHMDNVAEFLSRAFNDYCMTQGIEVQHSVLYVHT